MVRPDVRRMRVGVAGAVLIDAEEDRRLLARMRDLHTSLVPDLAWLARTVGEEPPRPEERFTALCGEEVTVAVCDVPQLGGNWFDPTCAECRAAWLARC